jgi:4a-hydroxytetrahydrobiopterin dehydratase
MVTEKKLSPSAFQDEVGVGDWRVMYWGAHAFFAARTFAQGAALVAGIAELVASTQHDPDVDLRREGVAVKLITRAARDLTDKEVELARAISACAETLGLRAEPFRLQVVQVALASVPSAEVSAFWLAALGYVRQGPSHLVDPLRRNPSFFLQDDFDPARPGRGRMHVDVCVPHDLVQARIDAARAAGGRTATTPSDADWWTLADAENHGVDILSTLARGSTRLEEA